MGMIVYVLALIKLLFFKNGAHTIDAPVKLTLFSTWQDYRHGYKSLKLTWLNYAGNLLMFVPMGLLLPVLFKKIRFFGVVGLGLLATLTAETIQYFTGRGYADADDVLMNFLGASIGAVIYFFVFCGRKHRNTANALSVVLLLLFGLTSVGALWVVRPDILPDRMTVIGGYIAAKPLDGYDIEGTASRMSQGTMFMKKNTLIDRQGEALLEQKDHYDFSDTAVFVFQTGEDEKRTYRITEKDAMIAQIKKTGGATVRLWCGQDSQCSMVLCIVP